MSMERLYQAIRNFEVNTSSRVVRRSHTWRYLVECIEKAGAVEEVIELLTDKDVVRYISGTSNTIER